MPGLSAAAGTYITLGPQRLAGDIEIVVVLALGLIGARVLWAAYPRLRRR